MTEHDAARALFENVHLGEPPRSADAIIAIGSNATSVASCAAHWWHDGYGAYLFCTGGNGPESNRARPEAVEYAEIALRAGVPRDRIVVEDQATNTLENARFTRDLLRARFPQWSTFLLVNKPYLERRTLATFVRQWPEARMHVASPFVPFSWHAAKPTRLSELVPVLLGEIDRIRRYGTAGDIVAQSIPAEVDDACGALRTLGYEAR